jgi:prephenate dehydrogenase
MPEGDFQPIPGLSQGISQATVAIAGLGLMGGSLAMALRGKCARLLGVDPDPETLALALQRGVVDQGAPEPDTLLPEADLIILAAPVEPIIQYLHLLPELHPGPAVVIDLGSTKQEICWAMESLPPRFDPLGGHPMCGRETGGLENASLDLYQDAPFAFTPLERTTSLARQIGVELAQIAGAAPLWLDPETHDRWTAATSHLPYLLASALVSGTPPEADPLIGPGFMSTTRVAATSPTVMLDILKTNRAAVLAALDNFKDQLSLLEDHLQGEDWESLRARLEAAAGKRRKPDQN